MNAPKRLSQGNCKSLPPSEEARSPNFLERNLPPWHQEHCNELTSYKLFSWTNSCCLWLKRRNTVCCPFCLKLEPGSEGRSLLPAASQALPGDAGSADPSLPLCSLLLHRLLGSSLHPRGSWVCKLTGNAKGWWCWCQSQQTVVIGSN